MNAYSTADWTDFFVAVAGASAALTGLLFVAVSINIERILRFPGLPERALATLLSLLAVLVVSLFGLVPGQSHTALGLEILVASLLFLSAVLGLIFAGAQSGDQRAWVVSRVLQVLPALLALAVGGALETAQIGGGLYWVLGGVVFGVLGAVLGAWVLLVEILR